MTVEESRRVLVAAVTAPAPQLLPRPPPRSHCATAVFWHDHCHNFDRCETLRRRVRRRPEGRPMSIFLYRLGGAVARRAGLVLGLWVLVLGGWSAGPRSSATTTTTRSRCPARSRRRARTCCSRRFGQTGTSGQIMFSVPSGTITGSASATAVADVVKAVGKVPHVSMSNPLKADHPGDLEGQAVHPRHGPVQQPGPVRLDARGGAAGRGAALVVRPADLGGRQRLQDHRRPQQASPS